MNETQIQFAQVYDRVQVDSAAAGPIDLSGLMGTWINTNPDSGGIARLVISGSNESPSLRAYAIGPDGSIDWGSAELKVFRAGPASRVAAGFMSSYDFGFAETQLQAMILKGLIVLVQTHHFKDNSNRADYFVREYFGLDHGRY